MKCIKFILLILFTVNCLLANAQSKEYTVLNTHSHNDYQNDIPFYRAYKKGFASIEADVFPVSGKLLVAHDKDKLMPDRSLKSLYLEPVKKELEADASRRLSLLIDIKQDYKTSLDLLIEELKPLNQLLNDNRLQIIISGSRPVPEDFQNYPLYISFDDDQSHKSNQEQWKRVALVSLPFSKFSKWNGKGKIVEEEAKRLKFTIDSVHTAGKKIRFWDAPDGSTSWLAQMELGVDLIGTDQVEELGTFLQKREATIYSTDEKYSVYKPDYKNDGTNRKAKNIILCIGDGMGLAQLYAAYTSNGGQLNIFQMMNTGLSITSAADAYCTDSAAGATAMATGQKTNNRAIGVDVNGKPLKSILHYTNQAGKKNALIAVCDITDATPAAFYAHVKDRSQNDDIAAELASAKADIIIGSGLKYFDKKTNGTTPFEKLKSRGYDIANSFGQFQASSSAKIVAILPDEDTKPVMNGRGAFLSHALQKVIGSFASNEDGFFIMMEGSQVDFGGHANNIKQVITENRDFDQAVGEALKFADQNGETLVIVTADHETGGLTLLDGDIKRGSVIANFSTADHTGTPVPVFAYGPGSAQFKGVYQNNELFNKMLSAMTISTVK